MLRITKTGTRGQGSVLRLEGRLIGPWVAELRALCEESRKEAKVVHLHLSEVDYIDRAGVSLLGELAAAGVSLLGTPPFILEQLPPAPGDAPGTETPR